MFNTQEKRERALGVKLFTKPHRCNSPKCALTRRASRPGFHGKRRRRALSEFGQQLQEKQKFQWSYGLRDSYMKRIFREAVKNPAVTGDTIIHLLERRLDNVVFRLGIAPSRSVGRQLVGHGHIMINGRKMTIPSYRVRVGDIITIRPESSGYALFQNLSATLKNYTTPEWLAIDDAKIEGKVLRLPSETEDSFDVNKVVDYYAKIVK
ncbi:MAG: 30S ribosomal protein S4 [Patescibacteria group bacterium]